LSLFFKKKKRAPKVVPGCPLLQIVVGDSTVPQKPLKVGVARCDRDGRGFQRLHQEQKEKRGWGKGKEMKSVHRQSTC
jgi:hypothetical protein